MSGTFRSKPSASQVKASKAYSTARGRAANYLGDKRKLTELINQASDKAKAKGKLGEIWGSFTAAIRMVKAYSNGSYRQASAKAMLMVVAALLYFVMPADLIPDFILGLGLIDDAALLAWTLQTLSGEISQFQAWEAEQTEKQTDIQPGIKTASSSDLPDHKGG